MSADFAQGVVKDKEIISNLSTLTIISVTYFRFLWCLNSTQFFHQFQSSRDINIISGACGGFQNMLYQSKSFNFSKNILLYSYITV